jgi:kynureninase
MTSLDEIRQWDAADPLQHFRNEFYIPKKDGKPVLYFCGNSLGLQPKRTEKFLQHELNQWKTHGVEGHFRGEKPWVSYHELAKPALARLVGAKKEEVVAVGSLTTNLHLLLGSFYQPKGKRVKMMIEAGAFPSDFYAAHSHMKLKGVNPEEHLIELKPAHGGNYLPTNEIISAIEKAGDELALVMLPGVQYYTGQFFNIPEITRAAHQVGAIVGFDLAHAIGNLPMHLHDDEVDFAVWCSYKYLNSGPGGIGGMFVHERHGKNTGLPRLSGWWGHNEKTRFKMANQLDPIPNVDGWQLSNVNILSSAAHLASLEIFDKAGILELREKSLEMTGWLADSLLNDPAFQGELDIFTPHNPAERGCQLSLHFKSIGRAVFDFLVEKGVMADWREPNVIRVAPVPLYNSFEDVWQLVQLLKEAVAYAKGK